MPKCNFIQFQAPRKSFAYEYYTRSNQFDVVYKVLDTHTQTTLDGIHWIAWDRLMVYYCCLFLIYTDFSYIHRFLFRSPHNIDFTVTIMLRRETAATKALHNIWSESYFPPFKSPPPIDRTNIYINTTIYFIHWIWTNTHSGKWLEDFSPVYTVSMRNAANIMRITPARYMDLCYWLLFFSSLLAVEGVFINLSVL